MRISPSKMSAWMNCERREVYKLHNRDKSERGAQHIASWIGTAVHALAADEEPPAFPSAIMTSYDNITQTRRQAEQQVQRMSAKITHKLAEHDYEIIQQEFPLKQFRRSSWPDGVVLSGTPDILVYHYPTATYGILDIKTSKDFLPAWLQMGAYALVWNTCNSDKQVKMVGALHCSRVECGASDGQPEMHLNDAESCIYEARKSANRIAHLMGNPDDATVAPGTHCRWCANLDCTIRAVGFNPRGK